jgi:hypothetical protein
MGNRRAASRLRAMARRAARKKDSVHHFLRLWRNAAKINRE